MKTETDIALSPYTDQDQLCINAIRSLAMDAVEKAESGHPGAPMGMAPMAYVLWTRFLRHDPQDPTWPDRDRFVLSAGHASMLLYSLLHLTGYPVSVQDLQSFRQFGSITPGHPEFGHTVGVETTTGPLGQGFANGVGMAMAERYLAQRFNRPGSKLFDHRVYAIVSDGDLMEGVSSEAASLAGHLQLGSLIYLYDSNSITIDGPTDLSFSESVTRRFDAYGWHTITVADGNDCGAIDEAIRQAQNDHRPSLIEVKTTIGFGAPTKAGTSAAHGAPLGPEEVAAAKQAIGWDHDPFTIPPEVTARMQASRGGLDRDVWLALRDDYGRNYPAEAKELDRVLAGELPEGWEADLPRFSPEDGRIATRKASGVAIRAVAKHLPELVGGSADLAESNNTDIDGSPFFDAATSGQNVHFGVREHAMGSVMNGMALHGLRPFGATFLVFSDYMRPSIRLAALMGLPTIYVFTHDSIGLGEDGPTHQPIEHLASLRAMPGLVVIRPGDANETVEAWRFALQQRGGPVALCLTRQGLPVLHATAGRPPPIGRGGYVLTDCIGATPDVILIATGSELHLAHQAAVNLTADDINVRVVSMPSWELFDAQPAEYRDSVLPPSVKCRVAVEAATTFGWCRFVGEDGEVVGVDRFGASAPGEVVMHELGITTDAVIAATRRVISHSKTSRSEDH